MIPTTYEERDCGAYDVGEDVEGVEVAAIFGDQGLDDFGADGEAGCAGEEGDVDAAASRGFEDPVEGYLLSLRSVPLRVLVVFKGYSSDGW